MAGKLAKDNWEKAEVFALIELWSQNKNDLDSMHVKRPIFEKVSESLHGQGIIRDHPQVQRKITSLKSDYTKKKPKKTGDSPSDWPFFTAVHQVLHESHYFNEENINIMEIGIQSKESTPTVDRNNGNLNQTDVQNFEASAQIDGAQIGKDSFVVDDRPVSNSSRQAKTRKRKMQKAKTIQEDTLEFLKQSRIEDRELMDRFAKSQEDNSKFLSQIGGSVAQLVSLLQNKSSSPPTTHYNWQQQQQQQRYGHQRGYNYQPFMGHGERGCRSSTDSVSTPVTLNGPFSPGSFSNASFSPGSSSDWSLSPRSSSNGKMGPNSAEYHDKSSLDPK